MQIGITGETKDWLIAAECGYDYFEERLMRITELDEADFAEVKKIPARTGLKARFYNCFFSGNLRLYELSRDRLKSYCDKAFDRAAALGGEIAVIGSGGARAIPEGQTKEQTEQMFVDILRLIGETAAKYAMKVVVEPLNKNETNFINTVAEGAAIARKVCLGNVGTLVDFYHCSVNGESLDDLDKVKDVLWHAHVARPFPDRGAPKQSDIPLVAPYAEALKKIGYDGAITVECAWNNVREEAREAFKVMELFR